MTPEFIMMVGLPGSGKTHWIRNHIAAHPTTRYTWISADRIVEQLAKKERITYDQAHGQLSERDVIAKLVGKLRYATSMRYNVINDQTNMTKARRASVMQSLPTDYRKIAVVFNVPLELLLKRQMAKERVAAGKSIPTELMTRLIAEYEAPDLTEFDEIIVAP